MSETATSGLGPGVSAPGVPAPLSIDRLETLVKRWLDRVDVSPSSVETYAVATQFFIQWLYLNNVSKPAAADILHYREFLEQAKKPTTVQLYISAVRQFFAWLDAEGVCPDIARHVKGPKIERSHKIDPLTTDQVKTVLGKIERQTERGRRDYAMILLMVTCGLRRIEVCRANVEDLQMVGDCARLYIKDNSEDEQADYVKLPSTVDQAIREYLSLRRAPETASAPLFAGVSNNTYGRLDPRSISALIKHRLRDAGCKRLCAHSLRHTAVTLALHTGQPLQEVQLFARHTAITTTMIYARNLDKESNVCAQAVADAINITQNIIQKEDVYAT